MHGRSARLEKTVAEARDVGPNAVGSSLHATARQKPDTIPFSRSVTRAGRPSQRDNARVKAPRRFRPDHSRT